MSKDPRFLLFNIDLDALKAISAQLEANQHQIKAAFNRAIGRTLTTMQKLSRQAIQDEIGAKSAKVLQNRVMGFRAKTSSGLDEMKIWYGLNDVAAHILKGRMSKQSQGVRFSSQVLGTHTFKRGFIADKDGQKYLFERQGRSRGDYQAARIGLPERVQLRITDDVFDGQETEIFTRHFETDLKGRLAAGLNKKGVEKRHKHK